MADSILRLKVESQEYDNKLKQAAQGLTRYVDQCRKVGGTLEVVEKDTLDYVRALGQMDTTSRTATGKLAEMKKTFVELSAQYKQMSDAEKQSPFGKALAQSLDELKGRIGESKVQLDDINKSINGGGGLTGALDAVAGKFGLSIDQVTKFGGVVGVATTALKVAKDAFMQSESNIDEWGRTVKGAEGAYDIFLQTLNNGNWSNFFSNLSQAITGARDLYDAFDRLNSIKANNAVAIATTQAEIQQLRLLKQQGQNVDDKIKDATQRLAALQAQSANAGINAGRQQVVNTMRNGVNSIGGARVNDATLKYVADKIAKGGQDYIDGMKRQATILEKKGMVTKTETFADSQGGWQTKTVTKFDINQLTKEQQKQYAVAKTITERETEIQKGLSVWSQSVQEQASATREQFRDNRYALQGSGGGGGPSGGGKTVKTEEQLNNEQIQKLTQEYIKASQERQAAIRDEIKTLQDRNNVIQQLKDEALGKAKIGGISAVEGATPMSGENPLEKYKDVVVDIVTPFDQFNERINYLKGIVNDPPNVKAYQMAREELEKTEKQFSEFKGEGNGTKASNELSKINKDVSTVASGIGGIFSGIQQMGIEIPQDLQQMLGVLQGITTIMTAITTILSVIEATSTVTATTSAVKSIPVIGWALANGGVVHAESGWGGYVPGNKFSGDQIPALLNSGELVLNKFQQEALAGSLQGNNGGGGYIPSHISGEQIWIAMNRFTKRTGRGELVTWK